MYKIPCKMNWCIHLASLKKKFPFPFLLTPKPNSVVLTGKQNVKVAKFNRSTEVHSSIFRGHLATIYESS